MELLPSESNDDKSQIGYKAEDTPPEDAVSETALQEDKPTETTGTEMNPDNQELPTIKELDKLNDLLDQIDAKLAELDKKQPD